MRLRPASGNSKSGRSPPGPLREQRIDRQGPRSEREQRKRQAGPVKVKIGPTLGNNQLDHTGHDQQAERREAGSPVP